MEFYTVTANFDMSSSGDLEVKSFLVEENAIKFAESQKQEFLNCISGGELDEEESYTNEYGLYFYGLSKNGEDFCSVRINKVTFEDLDEIDVLTRLRLQFKKERINNERYSNDGNKL